MLALLIALCCGAEPPLNEKVVAFARDRLGKSVGDGQCSTLVVAALRDAGVRRPRRGPGGWGEELKSLRDVRPGDILQFEGAVFVRDRVRADGGLETQTFTFPHHTAIVARVRKQGPRPVLSILHQNVGLVGAEEAERKVVQEWTIAIGEKRRGTVKAYRPAAD